MFSVEETAISAQMGLDKVERHIQTGAEYITGPDCSCLMHMAGVARKQGSSTWWRFWPQDCKPKIENRKLVNTNGYTA